MPEGLLHRNRCVVSISWVYPAPLTAGSIISLAYRSRSLWSKVVVERPPEDGCGGLQNKLNAAELLLGLLGHASMGRDRRAEPARRAVEGCYVSREGARTKPRPGRSELPSCRLCMLYVMCTSVCPRTRMVHVWEAQYAIGPGPKP